MKSLIMLQFLYTTDCSTDSPSYIPITLPWQLQIETKRVWIETINRHVDVNHVSTDIVKGLVVFDAIGLILTLREIDVICDTFGTNVER